MNYNNYIEYNNWFHWKYDIKYIALLHILKCIIFYSNVQYTFHVNCERFLLIFMDPACWLGESGWLQSGDWNQPPNVADCWSVFFIIKPWWMSVQGRILAKHWIWKPIKKYQEIWTTSNCLEKWHLILLLKCDSSCLPALFRRWWPQTAHSAQDFVASGRLVLGGHQLC